MYKTVHVPAACEACKDTCLARHRRISVLFLLSVIILSGVCKSNWTGQMNELLQGVRGSF